MMTRVLFFGCLLVCCSFEVQAGQAPHVRGELISSMQQVAPGESFDVLFRQEIDPGWHTYWINPGDSGAAPDIRWEQVEGVTIGDMRFPFPERIPYGPLMNYGYHDEVLMPLPVEVDPSFTGALVSLRGTGRVLVCADICIPEAVTLELTVPVAQASQQADNQALFERAESRVPAPLELPASYTATGESLALTIGLPGVEGNRIDSVEYFPYTVDLIDNPAEQTFELTPAGLKIGLVPGFSFQEGADLSGIVVIREGDGLVSSYTVKQGGGAVPASGSEPGASTGLLLAMLSAFLGGLILNLMPCVFPVLSIKVLSLVESAGGQGGEIRRHGWAYTGGVVASFLLIALLLVGLRAGGEAIGWGFQLQSPIVVALLAYLFVVIGLNLLGVFEFGGSLMQWGSAGDTRHSYLSSVSTGVLATVVAAPCTAPFMGAAIGYALLQSGMTGIVVFGALGFGMALPYLALCYSPALLARLPRPGAWMETLRQFLAFPMFASAIWLVWVLGVQAGPTAMMQVMAGALLIALALWMKGRAGRAGIVAAILLLTGALYVAVQQEAAVAVVPVDDSGLESGEAGTWSPGALSAAVEQGPVFVNFTAAWCITCKVNEINALEVLSVKSVFRDRGITYLKGDWTNENPLITEALQQHGRSGVPLYLLYGKGDREPAVLPQILTPAIVLEAIEEKLGSG